MKTRMLLFACLILLVSNYCNAQTWQWTHPEPNGVTTTPNSYTDGAEEDNVHDVETDAAGNIYVLGDFTDSLYINNIFRTAGDGSYLAKYDSTGKLLWYKLIVPTYTPDYYYSSSIRATDLTVNAQGVFIIGKYIPTGFQGGNYDCTTGIYNGLVRSYKIGNLNFNSGISEIGYFITKFNASGGVVWNELGTAQTCFNDAFMSPYNSVYNPLICSDKSNNLVCEFLYGGNQGNLITLGGNIPVPPPTNNVAFIVFKLNTSGALQWSNYAANAKYTSVEHDCNSITTDNNGNVFLYGLTSDSCQFGSIYYRAHFRENEQGIIPYSTFIAKISSTGTWQFAKELCNSSENFLEGGVGNPDYLTCDKSNNVYALVNIRGNGIYAVITSDTVAADKTSTYVVKLNNTGNLIYHKGFATNDTYANSIYFANNSFYISGGIRNYIYLGYPWYFSNLTVKPTSPNYGGAVEYFVSKADLNSNFQWVSSFSSPYNQMQGFAVKTFGDNVYSSGFYTSHIETLGNLNGTYNDQTLGSHNLFLGKLKDQYIKVGAVTPTTTCAGGSLTIPFTSYGLTLSTNNTFTAELSDTAGSFTSPVAIGSTASRGSGSIAVTLPNSLLSGSRYIVRIKSSDTLATGYNYYAYADTGYGITIGCPAPINLSTTSITATSATLNWATTSCGVKYSVQIRPKGTTAWKTSTVPGTATSYNATGLTANKAYQWRIATVCQTNPQVLSAYSAIQSFTTASSFVTDKMIIPSLEAITANVLSVTVSPNPASADAFVSVSGSKGIIMLTLTDISGKTIWQSHTSDNDRIVIPMQNLAPSTYLLSVRDDKQMKTLRVMKAQ